MASLTQLARQIAYGAGLSNGGFTLTGFNSLAAGSCLVASTAYSNSGAADPFWMLSFSLVLGGTSVAGDYISLYALPLNQDASTYGDGIASGAVLPSASYWVGSTQVKAGITSGNAIVGSIPFNMPWQDAKLVLANRLSVALNASAAAAISLSTARLNLNA